MWEHCSRVGKSRTFDQEIFGSNLTCSVVLLHRERYLINPGKSSNMTEKLQSIKKYFREGIIWRTRPDLSQELSELCLQYLIARNTQSCKDDTIMGEGFHYYSWIQNFEADFLQKDSLIILDFRDYHSFTDLLSVYLKEACKLYIIYCLYVNLLL